MLKPALEPYLPHVIMDRRKMDFTIPLTVSCRDPLKEKRTTVPTSQRMAESSRFGMDFVKPMDASARHSASLRSLLVVSAFLENSH